LLAAVNPPQTATTAVSRNSVLHLSLPAEHLQASLKGGQSIRLALEGTHVMEVRKNSLWEHSGNCRKLELGLP